MKTTKSTEEFFLGLCPQLVEHIAGDQRKCIPVESDKDAVSPSE